jgi:cytochrome c-type biogenesis protein CcmH
MAIWIVVVSVSLAVSVGLYMLSARRNGPAQAQQPGHKIDLYADQLTELDNDIRSGLVNQTEAEATRLEISRRILAADREHGHRTAREISSVAKSVMAALVPALAIAFYLGAGSPDFPDVPLADRLSKAVENNDIEAMIAKVELHLSEKPDDIEGWRILAATYPRLGRYNDAAEAYRQILNRGKVDADTLASFGEAQVFGNEGMVTSNAVKSFDEALRLDAAHPKARYFKALSLMQEGNRNGARTAFQSLLDDSPSDAPWRPLVSQQLAALAKAPALSDEQQAAANDISKSEQTEMIKGMVDGLEQKLAADGSDIEGWLRLIRARTVLGENDRASLALKKAQQVFKDKPPELASLRSLAEELKLQ